MTSFITKISQHFNLKTLLILAVSLVILIIFLIKISSTPTQVVEAGWYNDSWQYRQAINITSHTAAESKVYIIATINIGSTTKAKVDDTDFRFTNYAGQLLPYYISSGVGTTNITFHVFLSSFPAGSQTLYAYYDNLTAPSGAAAADFATQASSYTIGTYSAEETGGAPVGWWKFDEGYGTTANNSGGGGSALNGNFATGSSAPTWVTENNCISGKCLSFNGNGQYLSVNDSQPIKLTSTITISSWVYWNGSTESYNSILSKEDVSNGYTLLIKSNGQIAFYLSPTGGTKYIDGTGSSLVTGKWYFLTAVYDGSTISIWINGKLDSSKSATGTWGDNSASLLIGKSIFGSGRKFNGLLDDLKIYSYARTAAQIAADYNSRGAASSKGNANILGANQQNTQPGYTGPIAYWNFEEGSGSTAFDHSGNNYNATWHGTGIHYTTGKYGKAAVFDGTSDYLTSNAMISALPVTISLWVKPTTTSINALYDSAPATGNVLRSYPWPTAPGQVEWWNADPVATLNTTANEWQYLTIIYDCNGGTRRITGYRNGILQDQKTSATGCTFAWNGFNLGSVNTGQFLFSGAIDDVKIYNYVRTPAQIVQDMNGGHPAGGSPVGSQVAYYKFDEGVGTSTFNTITGNANGSISNASWTNNGKFGRALSFNGSSSYVALGSNTLIGTTLTGYTMSAWINPTGNYSDYRAIYYASTSSGSNNMYMQQLITTGYVRCGHLGGTVDTTTAPPANTWTQIVCTWDGTTEKIYLNGKFIISGPIGSNPSDNVPKNIGRYEGGSQYYSGLIDEVKLYSFPLSASDILIDYNRNAALTLGSLSTNSGSTAPNTAWSQSYCVPGDTTACAPPVGEWNFEEGSGTTAYDTSGNTNNGLLTNSPTWSPGIHGKSLNFNGSSQYISVPHNNSTFDVTSGVTLETWINLNAVNANNGIINKGSFANSQGVYSLMLYNWGNGSVPIFRLNGSTTEGAGQLTSSTPLTPGKWYHLAATYNQSKMTLYINGVSNTTNNYSTVITTDTNPLILGGYYSSSYTLNGKMDDVRVYNYARTPAQIALDYNHGLPAIWYKFNECQGATVNDSINIGTTGTITIGSTGTQSTLGTCVNGTGTTAAWGNGSNGKFGASLNFDGTDDYMTTGSTVPGALGPTSSFTLSAWVKANSLPTGNGDRRATIAKIVNTNDFEALIGFPYSGTTKWSLEVGKAGVGSQELNANSSATTGTWNHLVGVFNNGTASLYLNGVYQNSLTYNSTVNSATSINRGWTVASENYNGGYYYKFNGQVDDVRIYPYALNLTQIQTVYNEGSAVRFGPTGNP